jgi:hypothetical protein
MTTTGERLVAISTLTTGTAMEHFLNISTGGDCSGIRYFKLGTSDYDLHMKFKDELGNLHTARVIAALEDE